MLSVTKSTLLPCRQTLCQNLSQLQQQTRNVSSSPYGRTHVWRRRPPTLPNPVVPKFPQLVIRSDGTSFTHWTTSPRSRLRLTRDTTNNPIWNTSLWLSDKGIEEEMAETGRLGRFNRKFEGLGSAVSDAGWMEEMAGTMGSVEATSTKGSSLSSSKRPEKQAAKKK
ncbi:hypothetical protein AX17_002802 [Amanita inopinata Kibby_2008]|nr:hypothetical protein AX17_002802 [Amanita inopinata Kibby_2008]